MKKIGIYTGSFNPFHIGHKNIYDKACLLFDEVLILQGKNITKHNDLYYSKHINNTYEGLITDEIKRIGEQSDGECSYTLIRGLRNEQDFKYEQEQSYWIRKLMPELQIIYIECDEEFKHISSSALRQLEYYKQNIKKYLV